MFLHFYSNKYSVLFFTASLIKIKTKNDFNIYVLYISKHMNMELTNEQKDAIKKIKRDKKYFYIWTSWYWKILSNKIY